tara:strand:+ start:3247 stop:3993 length:747 start_codon:yes stop_codon:yes gene_type:complete
MAKTFGASIQTVYNTLQDLANKDQQGFVSPVEFNRFAQVAQLNIFNGLFDELKDVKKLSRSGFDPSRDKSRFKRIQEDLAAFSTKATLPKVSGVFNVSNATTASPMARIISMATAGSILLDQSTKKPIEICYDEEKIERILISNLSSPTEEFPIALVSEDIHVFPTSINKIEVRYYKYPEGRTSTGVRTATMPTYATTGDMIDFELPEHYVSDLVYEIGKMIGVNLRDTDIVNYTGTEMTARKQAETY